MTSKKDLSKYGRAILSIKSCFLAFSTLLLAFKPISTKF